MTLQHVYTDGSINKRKHTGSYSILNTTQQIYKSTVVYLSEHPLCSNHMELLALHETLKEHPNEPLIIHTDSLTSIEILSKAYETSRLSNKYSKEYTDLLTQTLTLIDERVAHKTPTRILHVKAHNGAHNYYDRIANNIVDDISDRCTKLSVSNKAMLEAYYEKNNQLVQQLETLDGKPSVSSKRMWVIV